MKNKVSIIVPVYNTNHEHLQECINSLIIQSYIKIEICIVDDGSNLEIAKTCDELQKIDERIKVIHTANSGVSAARNTGIQSTSGEYITFVDSDDTIATNAIELLVSDIINSKLNVVVARYSSKKLFNTLSTNNKKIILNREDAIESLFYDNNIPTGPVAKLFTRKIIGSDRFNTNYKYAEDLDFNFRILNKADNVLITDNVIYYYRTSENSAMRSIFRLSRMDGLDAIDNILKPLKNNAPINIINAVIYRYFMEAVFIGVSLNKNTSHKKELNKCYFIIKKFSIATVKNKNVRIDNRLFSLIAIFSPKVSIFLYRIRKKIASKLRERLIN